MFNEGLLRSFHDMFGLDYVALRYFNAYGPRMDIHGVYTEVLVRWMDRIASGQPPLILGDGKQTMDFVFVDDIARANLLAATVRRHRRGVQRRLRRRIEPARSRRRRCWRSWARDLEPEFGPERAVNPVRRRLADTSRAREALGFEAEVDLASGLEQLVAWWANERESRRGPVVTDAGRPAPIPIIRPWIGDEEAEAAAAAIRSGWIAQGPNVAELEREFAGLVGANHAVAVSNCTTALHLALIGAGVGPGDDVVVPSFSFIATTNAVLYVGATPVFCDVDEITGNVDGRVDRCRDHPVDSRRDRRRPRRNAGRPRSDPDALRRARDHRGPGRGLRHRIDVPGRARRRRRAVRRVLVPPAQARHLR